MLCTRKLRFNEGDKEKLLKIGKIRFSQRTYMQNPQTQTTERGWPEGKEGAGAWKSVIV